MPEKIHCCATIGAHVRIQWLSDSCRPMHEAHPACHPPPPARMYVEMEGVPVLQEAQQLGQSRNP